VPRAAASASSNCRQVRSRPARDRWSSPNCAHVIDLRAEEPLRERLAEKEVIDPQPGIARECIPEIIEEGIDCLGGVDRAQRIGPALLG